MHVQRMRHQAAWYCVKARVLTFCPSQRIYFPAFRPCLNKVPFQLVQLLANHKTTPVLGSVSFTQCPCKSSCVHLCPLRLFAAGSQIGFCLVPTLVCTAIYSAAKLVELVSAGLHSRVCNSDNVRKRSASIGKWRAAGQSG